MMPLKQNWICLLLDIHFLCTSLPVLSKVLFDPNFDQRCPFFGWLATDIIKKTFEHTTQYYRLPAATLLTKALKSPNPALNVYCRQVDVACDIVYSDVPAIYDGSTAVVIFVGVTTQVTDVYGIKNYRQFVNTLEDNIIQHGAPHKLISDCGQALVSYKVADIFAHSASKIGRVNPINSTRTTLNDATK
jgi:hypothetical protein